MDPLFSDQEYRFHEELDRIREQENYKPLHKPNLFQEKCLI